MNNVSFLGGETAGSLANRKIHYMCEQIPNPQTPPKDVVNFKGKDYEEKSESMASAIFGVIASAALIIGGLGLAHKYDVVGKLKDGKIKDFLRKSDKITEPCHKLCSKTKEYAIKYYNQIKEWFNKK